MSARILVVDDEPALLQGLAYALTREHFEVATAADGEAALEAAREHDFDLIILDLMLPKLSGIEVCRRLRAESAVPIIMLTARDDEVDKVLGLELGADDYITKPFSVREFRSRVKAVLRRAEITRGSDVDEEPFEDDGLRVDYAKRTVQARGEEARLTYVEFEILAALTRAPGRVFSRTMLLESVCCLLYTSPSPRDVEESRMPSSA